MKVLIIDNFDSFTFNLYQAIGKILKGPASEIEVIKNNEKSINEIRSGNYHKIVISPGPGNPHNAKDFGVSRSCFHELPHIPIFGVCLGMQGMAHAFGADIIRAKSPKHGKISSITHKKNHIFSNIPSPMTVMRYHSLVIDPATLPSTFEILAETDENEIMAIRHKFLPFSGVQFHPESFATDYGNVIIENFLYGD